MTLNPELLKDFVNLAIDKIHSDIIKANATGELEEIAKKYDILDLLISSEPCCEFYKYNINKAKILVLAIKLPNIDEWRHRAKKKNGVPEDRIEFQEIKANFDYSKLKNSLSYSDIIIGPVPHMGVGIGDKTSFISAVEKNPENYPKLHRMVDANGMLSLSQSAFEKCLCDTNLVKDCLFN